MSKRLRDHVLESNHGELKKNLDRIIKKSKFINRWIEKNTNRTEKRVLLSNLLASTASYLEVTMSSLNSHISVLALSTRSIYEINVRLRTLIESEDEVMKWSSEVATDRVQVLEGVLLLSND